MTTPITVLIADDNLIVREGIRAAREIRKRHPGTAVVVLSRYDDPEYAMELLAAGASGCAYLLKDRVAEGDELVRSIRTVSRGQVVAYRC